MPKYKQLYEWEKASHYATEKELQKVKKLYSELIHKLLVGDNKEIK